MRDTRYEIQDTKFGPLVSVLVPTFNRPSYFSEALASALHQSYKNLQVIVINDGGEDVSDIVNFYSDPRVVFIDRKENRGKAASLNEALATAKGKYIAYLDDDDLYYPNHIETLVDALENQTDRQVAYTDLYKVCCNVMPDGSRQVLSKVVEVSRDFDRFVMLYFNHVLHVSLMHHRDLLEKTGPYNEKLTVLIDWDMTRRLAFFSDFHHIHEITGEYYNPIGQSDRISVQKRKDKSEYLRNGLTIRTTRPPKPWPKINDLSIIFVPDRLDKNTGKTLGDIWRHTFYPYKLYLPLPKTDFNKLNTAMPNIVTVPVDQQASNAQRIDAALEKCDGEHVTIIPSGFPIEQLWIEDPLYALINSSSDRQALLLEDSTDKLWAVVMKKDHLQYARKSYPHLSVRQSLKDAGISARSLRPEEIPFQFDQLLAQARSEQNKGNFQQAAEIFEYIAENYGNQLWMKTLAAKALFNASNLNRAADLLRHINQKRPITETLLLEAKIKREKKDFNSAIELLKTARQILTSKNDYIVCTEMNEYAT